MATFSSLQFNGSSSKIECGTNALVLPDTFTAMAWIKTTETGFNPLICWDISGATPVLGAPWDAGKPIIYLSDTGGATCYQYYKATPAFNDGKWHHIAFAVVSNLAAFKTGSAVYVDGTALAEDLGSALGDGDTKVNMYIGRNAGSYFTGNIKDLVIYPRILSATEIRSIVRSNEYSPDYSVFYDFNEGGGAVAKDKSTNGLHGTITAGSYKFDMPYAFGGRHGGR